MNISDIKSNEPFKCRKIQFDCRTYRAVKEDDNHIFVFAPRKKRSGWRYSPEGFSAIYTIVKKQDETKLWHRRLKRAISKLEASGLWSELIPVFKNCLLMTWEDRMAIRDLYFGEYKDGKRCYDKQGISKYREKYPFAFIENKESGEYIPLSDYSVSEISECSFKSMYFGKYENKHLKEEIQDHINKKERYCIPRVECGYDVSFEYDPVRNKAWYSEEYRRCGNGHYYIAIDNNTAIFCEDD